MANVEPQSLLTRERVTQIVEVCFPPDPLATPAALSVVREGFEGDGEAYRRDFGPHLSCGAAVLIAAWGRYSQWRGFTCSGYPSDPHPLSVAACPQALCGARP
jgi:hypothetical protein